MMAADSIEQAVSPLAHFEQHNALAWRWRYRWRAWLDGARWQAEVQAGYADDQWRITGACPRWGGSGADQASAVDQAVGGAMHYWEIGRSGRRA